MADREATPFMSCFDFEGVQTSEKDTLVAGVKGNSNLGRDKNYKQWAQTHGPSVLGTVYAMTFETSLRANAFIKLLEINLAQQYPDDPEAAAEAYMAVLTELAQGADIKALAKMVLQKRTTFDAKSLVNPIMASQLNQDGEVIPGRLAALKDPAAKEKRLALMLQQKKEKAWSKKEKEMRADGFYTDEEIEDRRRRYFGEAEKTGKELNEEKFDGKLEEQEKKEEAEEPQGMDKVKESATDATADAAGELIRGGVTSLFG